LTLIGTRRILLGGTVVDISAFDACVDAAGGGDYTTIQGAEDVLAAPFTVLVKSGSYVGATLAKNATWYGDPGITITGEIQIDTAKVALVGFTGLDLQDIFDLNADDVYLDLHGGVDTDGINSSGARPYVSGGGWGSIMDGGTALPGIVETGADGIFTNIAADTTTGTTGEAAVDSAGARSVLSGVKVIDSEEDGISRATGADGLILGCSVLGADEAGILNNINQTRIFGHNLVSSRDSIVGRCCESNRHYRI